VSYCRFGHGSDVYVYRTGDGWECCACSMGGDHFPVFATRQGMRTHLIAHRAAGDKVPDCAIARLDQEIEEGLP
jgi:hypothetical protein